MVSRVNTDFCQAQIHSGFRTAHLLFAIDKGAWSTPTLPPGLQPLPMGSWETLSHTSGHQNSSPVFNHSPFEAVPRKIPCPPTVLRTLSFQVQPFLRAEQQAASQGLSIALGFFFFLLIGILFARKAEGFWERSRKPRDLPSAYQACRLQFCSQKAPGGAGGITVAGAFRNVRFVSIVYLYSTDVMKLWYDFSMFFG